MIFEWWWHLLNVNARGFKKIVDVDGRNGWNWLNVLYFQKQQDRKRTWINWNAGTKTGSYQYSRNSLVDSLFITGQFLLELYLNCNKHSELLLLYWLWVTELYSNDHGDLQVFKSISLGKVFTSFDTFHKNCY